MFLFPMKTYLGLIAVVLSLGWPVSSSSQADEPERGAAFEAPMDLPNEVQKRFAVIIGINYTARPAASGTTESKEPEPLRNAENDAANLRDLLMRNFGYQAECVQSFVGVEATSQRMLDVLGELEAGQWKGQSEAISPADSVLFFFSGHGHKLTADDTQLVLLPADVQFHGGFPKGSSQIKIHDVCSKLQKCTARHKLLILDCCYSGAVFELEDFSSALLSPRPNQVTVDQSPGRDIWPTAAFRSRSFQAIAASHSIQKASDGSGSNSPFTKSLLDALNTYPLDHESGRFPVSALFGVLGRLFVTNAPDGSPQYPQCRWLTPETGEFYFFPEGEFQRNEELDWRLQKQLIAMIPGVNGNWWFDESPWMLPSMREKVLKNLVQDRAVSRDLLSIDMLRAAARRYLSEPDESGLPGAIPASPDSMRAELARVRRGHLRQILEAKEFDRLAVLQTIEQELRQILGPQEVKPEASSTLEAVDLHFLAVLQQGLGKTQTAQERDFIKSLYSKALRLYRDEHVLRNKPLLTLCHTDYAWYLSEVCEDPAMALSELRKAGGQFENGGLPKPVKVFLLCREGDLLLQRGMWGAAAARWQEAYEIVNASQGELPTPLVAWAMSKQAWGSLDQWKVEPASKRFEEANGMLEAITSGEMRDFDALIFQRHNLHGQAITRRYSGDSIGASAEYDKLIALVSADREAHATTNNNSDASFSFAEVQARFTERLVNSLERRGDCGMFGAPPRLERAEDDYRLALRNCSRMKPLDAARWKWRLLDKRALALALPSRVQDVALSEALLMKSDELSGNPIGDFESRVEETDGGGARLLGFLARCILDSQMSSEPADEVLERLRTVMHTQSREGLVTGTIARDDLEALLFGTRFLVELGSGQSGDANRARLLDDIELLSNLCRLVRRGEDSAGIRRFLRPYYDAAINASLVAHGKHVRGIMELVGEAIWSEVQTKSLDRPNVPRLYLYAMPAKSVLLLDVPGEESKAYVIAAGPFIDKLQAASREESRRLSFPREFLEDWRKLPPGTRRGLLAEMRDDKAQLPNSDSSVVLWRDPIRNLGVVSSTFRETAGRSPDTSAFDASNGVVRAGLSEPAERVLNEVLGEFPFSIDELENEEDR